MAIKIARRKFLAALGGASFAWPLTAHSQRVAMPVIGFVNGLSPETWAPNVNSFRQGLSEGGYDEGRNVTIEYRWAQNQSELLPGMVAELVGHPVTVIVACGGDQAVQAAKAATATIPIVATIAADPVESGLVASLSRPGGNITGMSMFSTTLVAKRVQLLHEIAPNVSILGFLANPSDPSVEADATSAAIAAQAFSQRIIIVSAATERDCEAAFDSLQARAWARS
jgi:putative ABC transport system substrate-binding protein